MTDSVTIIEAVNIASGSSGKGGGLLAAWAEPKCLAPLSFALHESLAQEHGGGQLWGYRRVSCADCRAAVPPPSERIRSKSTEFNNADPALPQELDWLLPGCVQSYSLNGTQETTAQCHPFQFTMAMKDLACAAGAKVLSGAVNDIALKNQAAYVKSVNYHDKNTGYLETILATDVVVAAGAWTSTLLPEVSIGGAKSHSILLKPSRSLSANMLFLEVDSEDGRDYFHTPEAYPRPDGTFYACDAADPSKPLPDDTAHVGVDDGSCERVWKAVSSISSVLRESKILAKQACFQPVVKYRNQRRKNAGPLLGSTNSHRVFVASGHDSWGIQNAPATGKVLSEMILDGVVRSATIDSLEPVHVMQRVKKTV